MRLTCKMVSTPKKSKRLKSRNNVEKWVKFEQKLFKKPQELDKNLTNTSEKCKKIDQKSRNDVKKLMKIYQNMKKKCSSSLKIDQK